MNRNIKNTLKWFIVLFPIFIATIRPSIIWIVVSCLLYLFFVLLLGLKIDISFKTSPKWQYCILGLLLGIVCNAAFIDVWIPSSKIAFISSIFAVSSQSFLAIICIVIDVYLAFSMNILLTVIQSETYTNKGYRKNILDEVTFMNRGGVSTVTSNIYGVLSVFTNWFVFAWMDKAMVIDSGLSDNDTGAIFLHKRI